MEQTPAPAARPVMRDLSGPTQPMAPAVTQPAAETPAVTPAPAPVEPTPIITPIIPTSPIVATPPTPAPAAPQAAITAPNPAGSFHAAPAPAVLDLRNAVTPSAAATPEPLRLEATPAALPVTPTPAPETSSAPEATPSPTPAIITRSSDTREQNAQSTPLSSAISKFGGIAKPVPPQVSTQAAPAPAPAPTPTPAPMPVVSPAPLPVQPVATPAPASSLESAIAGVSAVSTKLDQPVALPNAVVTQVDAMASAKLNQSGTPSKLGPDEAMKLAMSTEVKPQFKPATIAAGLAAVIVMGGYIWINNYPKMTVKTAAAKAGIDATIPGYVPSSYSLAGQVAYGPGEITLNFNNATHSENLQIVQRRTSWDSGALLENFVAKTSSQYSAVEGQGLTVYLYGNGEASWVNHGIWYNIDGNNKLSREQLLKVIYSL